MKAILDVCYHDAEQVIRENLEDMHKVVAYLLEKETITGGEMVAIIEGRDPALVEDAYASTKQNGFRPSQPEVIEAPAKHIHMVSEAILPPAQEDENAEPASEETQPAAEGQTDEAPAPQPEGSPEPAVTEEPSQEDPQNPNE